MKKFLLVLFLLFFFPLYSFSNSTVDKTTESQLIKELSEYNEKLTELKKHYIDIQKAIVIMFFDMYDSYDAIINYEDAKNNTKILIRNADSLFYTIKKNLSYYDSQRAKTIYAYVEKDDIEEFKVLQYNCQILKDENSKIREEIKNKLKDIKKNKKAFSKEELSFTRKTNARARKDYWQISNLNYILENVAKANNIKLISDKQNNDFIKIDEQYTNYPSSKEVGNLIYQKHKNDNFVDDATNYHYAVNELRAEILPVLADLLLNEDEKKELELKAKSLKNNQLDSEDGAALNEKIETQEAYIIKALDSNNTEERLKNLSAEQKEQYKYVYNRMGKIFLLDIGRTINTAIETYELYKKITENPSSLLQQSTQENKPSKEELAFKKVVKRSSTASSKIIYDRLKQINEIIYLEENTLNSKEPKQKKVKKLNSENKKALEEI